MKLKLIALTIFVAMLMVACGSPQSPTEPTPDVAAVRTSAAGTVISQFTLTAAAFTPIPSIPTNTTAPEATVAAATATVTVPVVAQVTNSSGTPEALCDSLAY